MTQKAERTTEMATNKGTFSFEDDLKLIECVRQQPGIYDKRHPTYKDHSTRGSIWEDISTTIGKKADDCKSRWRNIRDTYNKRRRLRLRRIRKGSKTKNLKKWALADAMIFLDSLTHQKRSKAGGTYKAISKVDKENEREDNNNEIVYPDPHRADMHSDDSGKSEMYDVKSNILEIVDEHIEEATAISAGKHATDTDVEEKKHCVVTRSNLRRTKRRKVVPVVEHQHHAADDVPANISSERAFSAPTSLINSTNNCFATTNDDHPIDVFFKSMAMTVKNFPLSLMIEAKMEICRIVSELELRHFRDVSSSSSLPH